MGKTSRSTAKMSVGRGGRVDITDMFSEHKHSWPVQVMGLVIRSRVELSLIAMVIVLWSLAVDLYLTDEVLFYTVAIGVPVVVMAAPVTRRMVVGRFWCVVDRHRLRTCLRQSKIRTMNMSGALPFMLWARPTKTGERIWLWVRAGSSGTDIEYALEYIAPACFAREARIHEVRKLSTLIAVEIIRRDPLATSRPVDSPLSRLTEFVKGHVASEGTEPIRAASVSDIATARKDPAPQAPVIPAQTSTTKPRSAGPVRPVSRGVVINGEDLSDYVD